MSEYSLLNFSSNERGNFSGGFLNNACWESVYILIMAVPENTLYPI